MGNWINNDFKENVKGNSLKEKCCDVLNRINCEVTHDHEYRKLLLNLYAEICVADGIFTSKERFARDASGYFEHITGRWPEPVLIFQIWDHIEIEKDFFDD